MSIANRATYCIHKCPISTGLHLSYTLAHANQKRSARPRFDLQLSDIRGPGSNAFSKGSCVTFVPSRVDHIRLKPSRAQSRRVNVDTASHLSRGSNMASEGQSEQVQFENANGEILVGRLHTFLYANGESDDVKGERHRVHILCHGFRDTKDSKTIKKVADALHAKGRATFCFDFSGNGESEGEFEIGNYQEEVEDLRAAVVYLRGRGFDVGCALGHSKAGGVVLLYGSQYQDVDVLINVAGRYHMNRGIEERFGPDNMKKIEEDGFITQKDRLGEYKITKASIEARRALDMSTVANIRAKVLTVHGTKDTVIPVSDAQEYDDLFSAVAPSRHTLSIIEEADHVFRQHGEQLGEAVVSYIDTILCPHSNNIAPP